MSSQDQIPELELAVPPSQEQIGEAILGFLAAETWTEKIQIVENYWNLLLTDDADAILANSLYRNNEPVAGYLEVHRRLLLRCRNEGIGVAHARTALSLTNRDEEPRTWAEWQRTLGSYLLEDPLDLRAESLEEAIGCFEQALAVFTRQAFPEDWAMTQYNLADAYSNRIRGVRSENLERAIYHYGQALKVFTRQAFPEEWATVQNDLAIACANRIRGDRAENLEEAIHRYRQALEVRIRQALPEEWAMTQNNLASTYVKRIRGVRAENLERAIRHFKQALEVRTRQALPTGWAESQLNLANAYVDRIRGVWAENLEEAIRRLKQVLEVHTREALPERWAVTQDSLGIAYWYRIRGDRAENLEEAIRRFKQVLEIRTRQALPEQWAETQNNLASAFLGRIRGDRAENLERAIYHYEQVLEVRTRQDFPERWARTQNNLANVYAQRIRGDRAENLEEAIHRYRQALEIYTPEALPKDWADTQYNLAGAYVDRIRGDRAENLERAIHHYVQALEVKTAKAFPEDCRAAASTLGHLLYREQRFSEARATFETAHEAVEALRGEIQREGAKRALAEQNAILYARLVHCCLLEGDDEAAFKYAVAGKGRAFVDMLATTRFDLSAAGADNPELASDLRQARALRQQIDNLRSQLTDDSSSLAGTERRSPMEMYVELHTMQEQEAALWENMAFKYPALTATQQAPAFTADGARALAASLRATLVEYYRHAGGWCAFVVTPSEMRYVLLPDVNGLLESMSKWFRWIESPSTLGPLSYGPLRRLHEVLIAPLRAHLPSGGTVVLAPFAWLHLLPLGASLHPDNNRYAVEDYTLTFAPSLAALRVTLEQQARQTQTPGTGSTASGELTTLHRTLDQVGRASSNRQTAERLLSVAYPGAPESPHYLPNVLPEAEAVTQLFTNVRRLYGDFATPDGVREHARGQDVVHLGCHGTFDPETPQQSGLMLSGGWLTVQRIITELHLDKTRLVTVAACLSGRMEVRAGEEHVGLVQALMSAGARAVVASLWPVNDDSTRALFEAFYSQIKAGQSPAEALAEAGRLVRESPGWRHPYYWAAFQVNGLANGLYEAGSTLLAQRRDKVVDRGDARLSW